MTSSSSILVRAAIFLGVHASMLLAILTWAQ
jgi:hypothetical protein